jgi:rRNA processing protein Krr1/Pno1
MQSWEPFAIFLFNMICNVSKLKQALDNTEGEINNGQSRETGNVGKTKQIHNTTYVGHHCTQTNINNLSKT